MNNVRLASHTLSYRDRSQLMDVVDLFFSSPHLLWISQRGAPSETQTELHYHTPFRSTSHWHWIYCSECDHAICVSCQYVFPVLPNIKARKISTILLLLCCICCLLCHKIPSWLICVFVCGCLMTPGLMSDAQWSVIITLLWSSTHKFVLIPQLHILWQHCTILK